MKIKTINALISIFVMAVMNAAYGESTPPLSIIAAESVQNMQPNSSQTVSYLVKNNVPSAPVMLNMDISKTKLLPASTLISWEIADDCTYKGMRHYVSPGGQCHVNVTINSGSTAAHVHQSLLVNYGPTFQTIAPASSLDFDISGSASGFDFIVEAVGNNMQVNSTQTLTWTVSNTSASDIAIDNSTIHFTVASSLIASPVFTNDCANVVTAASTCRISTNIQSLSTAGQVSQYLAIPYGSGKTLIANRPTNFSILAATNTRTLTFDNQCPYDVWMAFVGGGQINTCKTDADCDAKPNVVAGTFVCDPNAAGGNGICNWKNPIPPNGNYRLPTGGAPVNVTLVENVYPLSATQHLVWSGVIGGRTSCTSTGCTTGDCGGGEGACPVGNGLSQPAQQAEPTFQQESDFYDITGINGLNIPMSIEPQGVVRDAHNPYTCGAPGITVDQAGTGGTIGGCSWSFVTPSFSYVWVAGGGGNCTGHGDCNGAGGEACGLSAVNIAANSAQHTCGKFMGYWTADQVCGMNSSYSQAPYSCNSAATNGTFTNMYACSGTGYSQSCYNSSGSTTCCGCQNWQEAPSNITIPSDDTIVKQCNATGNGSSNAVWIANALPTLSWYKAACPPFYVYPFDDKSSTFSCTNNSSGVNSTNYKITYCPGGNSGAPAGVTPNP